MYLCLTHERARIDTPAREFFAWVLMIKANVNTDINYVL